MEATKTRMMVIDGTYGKTVVVIDTFKVNDGATINHYSDSHACTVIEVSPNGKKIKVQRDKAVLLNGVTSGEADALEFQAGGFVGHTSGKQRYKYEVDLNGHILEASLRKNGKWFIKGDSTTISGGRYNGRQITKGRHEHYDFNF